MAEHCANLRAEIREGLIARLDPTDLQYLRKLLSRQQATDLEEVLTGSRPDGNQQISSEGCGDS
jgi:hypothetical protein